MKWKKIADDQKCGQLCCPAPYLRHNTSDRHNKHIDTKVYPLRVQSWKAWWKSSSNVWDTWQNMKEGKLSALQDKTWPFSVCGRATKLVLSRVERLLFPHNFVHRVQGDPGYHNNRKWLLFARRRAVAADRPEKRALFLELVNLNERYSLSSRWIFTDKLFPFRLGKDLSISIYFLKIRAKMTPQRRSKAIDDYLSKIDWPGVKLIL